MLDKVCGDKVCVEKVFVDKVYGDKVWRRAEEEKAAEEEPGIQNQKQEPHTKTWGKRKSELTIVWVIIVSNIWGIIALHELGNPNELLVMPGCPQVWHMRTRASDLEEIDSTQSFIEREHESFNQDTMWTCSWLVCTRVST